MSKYAPLAEHLTSVAFAEWRPTFRELESLLGFRLPDAARRHRAWWSNNGSNNVMTKAWLEAGWRTEQVDMSGEKLVFRRARPQPQFSGERSPERESSRSLVGALRGTVRILDEGPESTGEVWKADRAER